MTAAGDMKEAGRVLHRQRLAALLEKYRNGKASRLEIEELYRDPEIAAVLPPREKPREIVAPAPPPPPPVPSSFVAARLSSVANRDRIEAAALLNAIFAKAGRIELPPPIVEWVRENVVLTAEESKQFPGKYNPDLTPGVTILFDFIESPFWSEFIACKSSQFGMTLAFLAALMHKIKFKPRDVAFAINNREEIKRINEVRILPMLRACQAIADRLPADPDRLQNHTLYLIGLTLYLLGGHSAGAAANKSLDWAAVDECDETPEELKGNESTIIDLLRDRLKRQDGAKLIAFSKPRNEDDIIWPEYLHGSRHKIFVPCPHCSGDLPPEALPDAPPGSRLLRELVLPLPRGYQTLVRSGLRYDHCRHPETRRWDLARMLRETFYDCIHCGGRIEEKHKAWMLRHRLYIPTNTPNGALQDDCKTLREDRDPTETEDDCGHPQPVPGKLSFQVSDFYALEHQPASTFGHLAVEIVTATNLSKQRKFRRSREGLPVGRVLSDNSRTVASIRLLAQRQPQFTRGHCSRRPLVIILGVDVQHYGKKWVKCAFYENDDCELVDYGVEYKGFGGLIKEADKPVIVDDWGDTPEDERINPIMDFGLIDEGDGQRTKSVLAFCISPGAYRRFFPCKGRGGAQTAGMPDLVIKQKKNRFNGISLPRYLMNADAFAEELYDERIARSDEIETLRAKGLVSDVGALRLFKNPDHDLCVELTTHRRWTEDDEKEKQRARRKLARRGRILRVGDWFRDGGPDDYGDALTECLAGWYKIKARFGVGLQGVMQEDEGDGSDEDADD